MQTRIPESEKVTINLGLIDLGQIDLLVNEGVYANRTDLIRTAIRNQLAQQSDIVQQTIARKKIMLGLISYDRASLEAIRNSGKTLRIQALGLVRIESDVDAQLAADTIEAISVLGGFQAPPEVKAVLAKRII